MKYTTLIGAAQLHESLPRQDWVVVDCRFDLLDPAAGERAYEAGHIPGAVYAHLDRDLAGPITAKTGRHPLPDRAALAARLGQWGIGNASEGSLATGRETQVIAYDAVNGMFAARLWWLLRWLGHESVAVLDGGLKAWQAAGYPLNGLRPSPTPAVFHIRSNPAVAAPTVSADEVATRVSMPSWRVLDARAAERFAGAVEPIDPVAGHVPGAHNHPLSENLQADGRFLPAAALRERLRQSIGHTTTEKVISMCGSGVTACHTLLALEIAGLRDAHLYPGSWSEWIRDSARPVKQGSES